MPRSRRPRPVYHLTLVCLAAVAVASGGCGATGPGSHWKRAAGHLEEVAKIVDEYGTVSGSAPMLIANTGQFAMNYDRSVGEYVDGARTGVQAAVRQSDEQALDVQNRIRVQADVSNVYNPLGVLPDKPNPDLTAPTDATGLPIQTRAARGALSSDRFTAPLPLGPRPAALSERQALLIGVNDKATETILKNLFDPKDIPGNVRVYIVLFQVSCQPGWRTRRGYVADISVRFGYAKQDKDGNWVSSRQFADRVAPSVFSVFPSVEAQTLDAANSQRRQAALANELAAVLKAGPAGVQAENLVDYARRLERDAATRTAVPIVSGYSRGNDVGYQIRPVFQALSPTGSSRSTGQQVLHPVNFPALAVLVLDEEDIKSGDGSGEWTHLETMVSTRWIPGSVRARGIPETKRAAIAQHLDQTRGNLFDARDADPKFSDSNTGLELVRRMNLYRGAALGLTRISPLPPVPTQANPTDPSVTSVRPTRGWSNATTALAIEGTGFTHNGRPTVERVLVGGVDCDFEVVSKTSLVAVVPAGALNELAPTPRDGGAQQQQQQAGHTVTVVTTQGVRESREAVTFDRERDVALTPALPGVVVQRDAGGRVTAITVAGDADLAPGTLLDAVREVLKEEGVGDNINVDVSASGRIQQAPAATQPGAGGAPAPQP